MPPHTKAQRVPPSAFSEPSEPSDVRPEDKPADTLRGEQEENPQLVAHEKGRQAGDNAARVSGERDGYQGGGSSPRGSRSVDVKSKVGAGRQVSERSEAERVDERKRKDVAGGFGLGRGKL